MAQLRLASRRVRQGQTSTPQTRRIIAIVATTVACAFALVACSSGSSSTYGKCHVGSNESVVKVSLPILGILQRDKVRGHPYGQMSVHVGDVVVVSKYADESGHPKAVNRSDLLIRTPEVTQPLERCDNFAFRATAVGTATVTSSFQKGHFGLSHLGINVRVLE